MAKVIENLDGKRRMIKLSTEDVLSIIREYQLAAKGCVSCEEIRTALGHRVFFIPEEI